MRGATIEINGKQVEFEPVEQIDNHGHSREWAMDGYTDGVLTHTATGSYTFTEEFEEIDNIEKIN